jgi:CheY-like chemotaxis protein
MASKHILAIDDDTDNLELVSLALQLRAGWQVTQVTDGARGIRMAADRPDLILLDVHMPRLRGPRSSPPCARTR